MTRLRLLLAGLVLLLAGCQIFPLPDPDDHPEDALVMRYGTSFGECLGYCFHELRLDESTIVLTRRGYPAYEYPEYQRSWPMRPAQWEALMRQLDVDTFLRLHDIYGCPDCADGGAEWIAIEQHDVQKKVMFEYGHPPAAIAALQADLRRLLDSKKPGDP